MNGWIKYYADGSVYTGADQDVYAGRASWRKSSFHGLIGVGLTIDGQTKSLNGFGEYWQSDEFESTFSGGTKMVKRRIQKKITPGEYHNDQNVGKWSTIEYDCKTKQWAHKILEGKI